MPTVRREIVKLGDEMISLTSGARVLIVGGLVAGLAVATTAAAQATDYPVGSHVMTEWQAHESTLGDPTGPETAITALGQTGYEQQFQNDQAIVASSYGEFIVAGPILDEYDPAADGFPAGEVATSALWGGGSWQRFQDRTDLVASNSFGAQRIPGSMNAWNLGSQGWPMSGVQSLAGGSAQYYGKQRGTASAVALAKPGTKLQMVANGIYPVFVHAGGVGRAGWPTSGEYYLARCRENAQTFSHEQLYQSANWCPPSDKAQPTLANPAAGPGYTIQRGFNGSPVAAIQHRLGMWGYDTTFGPITTARMQSYERAHHLPVTTDVTATVWNRLGIRPIRFSVGTWAAPDAVSLTASAATRRAQIVAYAKAHLGRYPYYWGGTGNAVNSSQGFDCSGLSLQAIRSAGVHVRNVTNWADIHPASDLSNQMWHDTEFLHVSTASLLPGDLVFYGTGTTAHHVAIYVGGGKAIQALDPRHGIVELSVWNTSGWPRLLGVVRPIATTANTVYGATAAMTPATRTMPQPLTGVGSPTIQLDGVPLQPVRTNARPGATVTAGTAGMQVSVTPREHLRLGLRSGQQALWVDAGGFVISVRSAPGEVTAPAQAARLLVVPTAEFAGATFLEAQVIDVGP